MSFAEAYYKSFRTKLQAYNIPNGSLCIHSQTWIIQKEKRKKKVCLGLVTRQHHIKYQNVAIES